MGRSSVLSLRLTLSAFIALLLSVHLTPVQTTDAQSSIIIPPDRPGLKGIVGHWWYADRYGPRLLDEYAAVGATNVRMALDWLHIEPVQGERSFDRMDPIIFGLRDRGIEVLPVIATMPPWATWNGGECFLAHLKCRLNREVVTDFQITMGVMARRYAHIKTWEFWNEPEMWEGMRDPDEYEFWYRAFYAAVKEANPSARVAIGTLTGWDFVQQMSPTVPYDAVSVHSYGDHRGEPLETTKIYNLYLGTRSRGREVPIWLTEYGWNSQWLDARGVADALDWSFRWLLDQPYIEFAHYHMLHDTQEYWECCFGLIGPPPDFAPKLPAWDRFRGYPVIGR